MLKTVTGPVVWMCREIDALKLSKSHRQREEEEEIEEEGFVFSLEEDDQEEVGEWVGQQEQGDDAMCGIHGEDAE